MAQQLPPAAEDNNNKSGNSASSSNNNSNNNDTSGWSRGKTLPADLLKPGEGSTDEAKKVLRFNAEDLLSLRLNYLSKPLNGSAFTPTEAVLWTSEDRLAKIDATVSGPKMPKIVCFLELFSNFL